jgi:3'-5' exonuclease
MLDKVNIENIFFIDTETVPQYPDFLEMPEDFAKLWIDKAEKLKSTEPDETPEMLYNTRAGIYSEFGKIVCISVGYFRKETNGLKFRVKSYYDEEEKKVLLQFSKMIHSHFKPTTHFLCAHNGREFDFPFIARRMLVNNMELPAIFDLYGKKPWEIEYFLDTMQLWRFGDIKNYTSLKLMCYILNIPTPKTDIEGKDVANVFWKEHNLKRIADYCEKDVLAIARLVMRYKGMEIIPDEDVIKISD